MRYLFRPIFVCDPLQHLASSVVVEVCIYIGEGDAVRVEETFEEQVVFDRVNLRDAKAVGCLRLSRVQDLPIPRVPSELS